jgi:hypothetical protein
MSEINHFKVFVLRKMAWQMMWTRCMCIEFILVGTNYTVIRDFTSNIMLFLNSEHRQVLTWTKQTMINFTIASKIITS